MENMEGRCWNNMMRGEEGGSHIIDSSGHGETGGMSSRSMIKSSVH